MTTTTTAVKTTPSTISTDIVVRINTAHQRATEAAQTAVEAAFECGQALIEAKTALPHGEFQDWVRENCTFSIRMAQKYMKVAKRLPDLQGKNEPGALLTIADVLSDDKKPQKKSGDSDLLMLGWGVMLMEQLIVLLEDKNYEDAGKVDLEVLAQSVQRYNKISDRLAEENLTAIEFTHLYLACAQYYAVTEIFRPVWTEYLFERYPDDVFWDEDGNIACREVSS